MSERTFETTGSLQHEHEINLEECHNDPIHQSVHIQPHGTFLEIDPETMEIRSAAKNTIDFLNGEPSELIGQHLSSCFDSETTEELQTYFDEYFPDRRHFVSEGLGGSLTLYVFPIGPENRSAGIEVEKSQGNLDESQELITNVTDQLHSLQSITDRSALYDRVLEYVASFTGFERLMVYQFDEEGHGTVVAERASDDIESYLGRRFPASDIPEPARRLYRKNSLRLIPNVEYDPVPVLGPDGERQRDELDLTYSSLRSVPAVHRQYMRNMGVSASISVSLMVEGELWGLISGHAMSPNSINWSQKSACKLISRATSQQLTTIASQERERQYNQILGFRDQIDESFTSHDELFEKLNDSSDALLSLMDANAFYLELDEHSFWAYDNESVRQPAEQLLPDIQKALEDDQKTSVRSIVSEWDDNWSHSSVLSGFLTWRLSSSARSYCVWFRPEHQQTIEWGGDPRNPVDINENGELSPRSSFDTWTQVVSKQSRRWSDLDTFSAREISRVFKEFEIELQKNLLQTANQELENKNNMLEQTRKRLEKINQEKEQLLEQVREMARTDDLTGLLIKEEFLDRLSEEVERAKRYNHTLSLAFMDLDHFKSINDRFGHQTGDDVLEKFGELLQDHSRSTDILGRYGGEEFIAALPSTSIEEAEKFCERFLESLRQHTFSSDGETFEMTCSIGLTELDNQDDVDDLIERADTALYEAKNSGRDQCCVGEPE